MNLLSWLHFARGKPRCVLQRTASIAFYTPVINGLRIALSSYPFIPSPRLICIRRSVKISAYIRQEEREREREAGGSHQKCWYREHWGSLSASLVALYLITLPTRLATRHGS